MHNTNQTMISQKTLQNVALKSELWSAFYEYLQITTVLFFLIMTVL